jgi:tRNA pseudouridine38-40 synthase
MGHVMTPDAFHCRACATSRRYAYVLYESPIRPSVDHGSGGLGLSQPGRRAMQQAAEMLLGEHDFTSFRASQCQALTPVKELMEISMSKRGAYWRIEFEANAFLHHMIRNIMGCLVQIGQGKKTRSRGWPKSWQARDRRAAAPTFSPDGLYFLGPRYDPKWGIPDRTAAYDGLP